MNKLIMFMQLRKWFVYGRKSENRILCFCHQSHQRKANCEPDGNDDPRRSEDAGLTCASDDA